MCSLFAPNKINTWDEEVKMIVINFAGRKLQHSFFLGKRLPLVFVLKRCGNDPSAGSPTETLLRLHLPLNDEV